MPHDMKYSGSNSKPLKSSVYKWCNDLLTLTRIDFHPLTIEHLFPSERLLFLPNSHYTSSMYLLEIAELALLKFPQKIDAQRQHARNLLIFMD